MAAAVLGTVACGTVETTWFVDQVDEERAVLVAPDGSHKTVPEKELPRGAREGDLIVNGRIDALERARRERAIEELRARLRVRTEPDGDLEL